MLGATQCKCSALWSLCVPFLNKPLSWGYPFLYESYLYHLHRLDHRHNFSPYFYQTYLTYPSLESPITLASPSLWSRLLRSPLTSFVPQIGLAVGLGLLFGRKKEDLVFTWFLQTTVFVVFNKVCTSQVKYQIKSINVYIAEVDAAVLPVVPPALAAPYTSTTHGYLARWVIHWCMDRYTSPLASGGLQARIFGSRRVCLIVD